MQIRQPTRADLARLAAIEAAADQLYVERFGALDWAAPPGGEERAAAPGFLLVAGEEQAASGFVHVLDLNGAAHLEQLAVDPEQQRRGIGRSLVEAAKREAADLGYRELSLLTYAEVPWNAPFYATCGFEEREPATSIQRHLLRVERQLGLESHGRRVLMVASITPQRVTRE